MKKVFMGEPRARARIAKRGYDKMVEPGAKSVQEALMDIIAGGSHPIEDPSMIRRQLGEMAGSDQMLNLLKAMPAAGGLYGVGAVGDVVAGEESFANKGMDLLGMGAGMYGINRGRNGLGGTTRAGQALAYMAAMGLGKMGSDAAQGVIGG